MMEQYKQSTDLGNVMNIRTWEATNSWVNSLPSKIQIYNQTPTSQRTDLEHRKSPPSLATTPEKWVQRVERAKIHSAPGTTVAVLNRWAQKVTHPSNRGMITLTLANSNVSHCRQEDEENEKFVRHKKTR